MGGEEKKESERPVSYTHLDVYKRQDVFRNYLENGRVDAVAPDSFFCKKQKLIFRYLFEKMKDENFVKIMNSWIH